MENNAIEYGRQELCNQIAQAQENYAIHMQELSKQTEHTNTLTVLINCDSTVPLAKKIYLHRLELVQEVCNSYQKMLQSIQHNYIPNLQKMLALLTTASNQLPNIHRPQARRIPKVNLHLLEPIYEALKRRE